MSAAAALKATDWRSVFDSCDAALLVVDAQGLVQEANPAALALFKFQPADMQGVRIGHLVPYFSDELPARWAAADTARERGQELPPVRVKVHTAGAQRLPASVRWHALAPRAGTVRLYALWISRVTPEGTKTDISTAVSGAISASVLAQKPAAEPVGASPLATSTTASPVEVAAAALQRQWLQWVTRQALHDQFLRLRASPDAANPHVALVLLNVDHFKRVNDLLGFEAGDLALVQIGERLLQGVNAVSAWPQQVLAAARLNGDEFALMLQLPSPVVGLPAWLGAVLHGVSQPLETQSHRFVFSMSVGMAQAPFVDHKAEFDALLSAADRAMRRVKKRGGNGFEMASPLLDWPSVQLKGTEHNVILGMERQQFHPFFQPKVNAETGQIVGFEALMRWLHPEQGLIPLNEFLPMLESSSLMIEVGLQIFQQIVDTQRQWQLVGCHLPISFNVSNGELLSKAFRDGMVQKLRQAGLSAQGIGLEITETVLADLGETGNEIVEELRREGFQLSMDDFGVGTSSLSRLKNIPLNEIKVDRSFIVGIVDSDRNLDLLRGIVNLGQSLGLKVVLEGVETPKEYELACTLGDLIIQGFYYSQAVDSQSALVLAQKQPFSVH